MPNVEQARFNMIEQQIRPWNVLDQGVLSLLGMMRREDFLPVGLSSLAFMDTEIPLAAGQSMLAPKLEARLLQELHLQHHERLLEIGSGSGFTAALAAHKVRSVLSLEINPLLAKMAAANLQRAGVMNAKVREANGAFGAPADAPFDAISLSGSVAAVPQVLLDQLAIGGRLIAVVGEEPMMRALRITRTGATTFERVELFDTVAPRLSGFEETSRFSF
jgi:protein-L-isoaspartate(D-aspartate) O-methyltransferase